MRCSKSFSCYEQVLDRKLKINHGEEVDNNISLVCICFSLLLSLIDLNHVRCYCGTYTRHSNKQLQYKHTGLRFILQNDNFTRKFVSWYFEGTMHMAWDYLTNWRTRRMFWAMFINVVQTRSIQVGCDHMRKVGDNNKECDYRQRNEMFEVSLNMQGWKFRGLA